VKSRNEGDNIVLGDSKSPLATLLNLSSFYLPAKPLLEMSGASLRPVDVLLGPFESHSWLRSLVFDAFAPLDTSSSVSPGLDGFVISRVRHPAPLDLCDEHTSCCASSSRACSHSQALRRCDCDRLGARNVKTGVEAVANPLA